MTYLAPRPNVVFHDLDDEMVLANLDSGDYFALNEVGASIWRALSLHPSLDAAVQALLEEYEVPEAELRADIGALVQRLGELGLAVIAESQTRSPGAR
jgi:hypothetical protein